MADVRLGKSELRIASLCSGFEVGALAAHAICSAIESELHGAEGLRVTHMFACELDKSKRALLRRAYPDCNHIFHDVEEVARGRAYDEVSESLIDVPSCDLLTAGISCKDFSRLNNHPRDINDERGTSGRTLRGLLAYIKSRLPPVVIIENVLGFLSFDQTLQSSAADFTIEELAKYGYVASTCKVNSLDFALPQQRNRMFIIVAHSSTGIALQDVIALTDRVKCKGPDVNHFLFPCRLATTQRIATPSKRRSKWQVLGTNERSQSERLICTFVGMRRLGVFDVSNSYTDSKPVYI